MHVVRRSSVWFSLFSCNTLREEVILWTAKQNAKPVSNLIRVPRLRNLFIQLQAVSAMVTNVFYAF